MNARPGPRKMSLVSKVLLATLMCLFCLVGALSHVLLGSGQGIEPSSSRSAVFKLAQFTADVRTMTAAISYLLEPEPEELVADSGCSPGLRDLQARLAKLSRLSSSEV